jgi:hypothetical protein
MLLIDKITGVSPMRVGNESRALHLAMCAAVFGFVAGLLVFAHPASLTAHTISAISTPMTVFEAPKPMRR